MTGATSFCGLLEYIKHIYSINYLKLLSDMKIEKIKLEKNRQGINSYHFQITFIKYGQQITSIS